MQNHALSQNIVRQQDGWYAAVYGPFALKSAFQPIFRQIGHGKLRLEAFEGLIRPTKGGHSVSPYGFFASVPPEDGGPVDALCRQLHLLNMGQLDRPTATLFLNFDPRLFNDARTTATEVARLLDLTSQIGLAPRQIVCEITEKKAANRAALVAVVDDFRGCGFRIAVDDYGAEDSDIARIELLKPDIVKFDGDWVLRYMEHAPGVDLLRDTVQRFRANGIATLFEGLEHPWHVDVAIDLKVDMLQGYALAKPDTILGKFNDLFPDQPGASSITEVPRLHEAAAAPVLPEAPSIIAPPPVPHRPIAARKTFGKRGR